MSAYQVKANPALADYEGHEVNEGSNVIRRFSVKLSEWLKERHAYYTAVSELESMSDRDLADIGIVRCDIPAIARGAAKGQRAA